jgi:hypothetical protein
MKCFVFADESGNSGLKLFDDGQDTFWTGTVIAFADLDRKYTTFHRELLSLVEKPELHGNELGFGRIEKIAGRLAWFIREKKLRFSFIRIFKPYLATTKLFDLAFDSGVNPAVPPQAYGIRHLRFINLLHFSQLLTTDDLNEFWSLFEAQDVQVRRARPATGRARRHRVCLVFSDGGDDGLKSLPSANKKLTGTVIPLSFRVTSKAFSTS